MNETEESVQKALRILTSYALPKNQEDKQDKLRKIGTLLDSFDSLELKKMVDLSVENRIQSILSEILDTMETPNARAAKDILEKHIFEASNLRRMRDEIIYKLVMVLSHSSIDYVLFKTFNRYGAVGVDVDLMIPSKSYPNCIQSLQINGFYPIDDLSKTYATGFMTRGNPIIVDLHTKLAVLGVSYLSSSIVLTHGRELKIDAPRGLGSFIINVLDDDVAGVVALGHSIIKEEAIRISDLLDVLNSLERNQKRFEENVKNESLQLAANVFAMAASAYCPEATSFKELSSTFSSLSGDLSQSFLMRSVEGRRIPLKIPASVSILVLLNRLRRRKEMTTSLGNAFASFWFRRNLARLGQKMTKALLI